MVSLLWDFPEGPYDPDREGVLPTVIVSLGKGAPISDSIEELRRRGSKMDGETPAKN